MSAEDTVRAAHQSAALFSLPNHIILYVHGPDAVRYLHGRLTQEVQQTSEGNGAQSLLLSPQGKIQGKCLLLVTAEGLYLLADPGSGEEDFIKHLLQFKVADQLEVDSLGQSHQLLSFLGPKSAEILSSLGADLPTAELSHCATTLADTAVMLVRNSRGAPLGFDILLERSVYESVAEALSADSAVHRDTETDTAFEMLRISAGIPQAGVDLSEKIIATDIPIEHLVSFEKGCYAGQEVVEMSIARGRPNRQLLVLAVTADHAVEVGTAVSSEGKNCGTVTSSCFFPSTSESYCLALVKSSITEDATLLIANTACRRL